MRKIVITAGIILGLSLVLPPFCSWLDEQDRTKTLPYVPRR